MLWIRSIRFFSLSSVAISPSARPFVCLLFWFCDTVMRCLKSFRLYSFQHRQQWQRYLILRLTKINNMTVYCHKIRPVFFWRVFLMYSFDVFCSSVSCLRKSTPSSASRTHDNEIYVNWKQKHGNSIKRYHRCFSMVGQIGKRAR